MKDQFLQYSTNANIYQLITHSLVLIYFISSSCDNCIIVEMMKIGVISDECQPCEQKKRRFKNGTKINKQNSISSPQYSE